MARVAGCEQRRHRGCVERILTRRDPQRCRVPDLDATPMLTPGQTLAVTIEKPAAGGRMIARVDGQVVLVSGTIPGERVEIRISRTGKGVAFGETIAVLDASPDRRDGPGDPLCGGSLLGHISYARQLDVKRAVIADAFARIGHLDWTAPVHVAGSREDGYRMRARLHVRGARLGFFREGTHDVCDVRQTRQLLPATCDVLDRVMAAIRSIGPDAVRGLELSENIAADQRVVHLDTAKPLDRRVLDKLTAIDGLTPGPFVADTLAIGAVPVTLRRHVLAFFQGNRHLLRELVAHVVDLVPDGPVIDLYAGVGLFAMGAAAARGVHVTAVEGDRIAAADLDANAAAYGTRVAVVPRPVEVFLARLSRGSAPSERAREGAAASHSTASTTVIVDPPRTGMTREALDGLLALAPRRWIYVSCDVATLARDARRIVDAGYAITRVDAFDLFPNTPHVETVMVFDRSR